MQSLNHVGPGRTAPSCASAAGARSLAVSALIITAVAMLVTGCGKSHSRSAAGPGRQPPPARLPQVTTYMTLKGVMKDTDPAATGDGTVVHPVRPLPVSATPGGSPVASLPTTELGSPTWLPVVETRPGWQRVLLPSRPNGATGWIRVSEDALQTAHSPYLLRVDTSARQLTILRSGHAVGTWSVAVGASGTPTPAGRTFLLASLTPAKATYSPLILPVGAHSETLDTFGGGPGTVAFHGWPQKSVFGRAVTHGCVRVPADALKQLSQVPLGTAVLITG